MSNDIKKINMPLASRVRPTNLKDFCGQKHLLGEGRFLRDMIENDRLPSMIFWGEAGVGKTTLTEIIATKTNANFVTFSAVMNGIKEIREIMNSAEKSRLIDKKTIVFVDEIHRFNKAQQDAFLPYVEKGSVILIGATTENPSFEINSALLSRMKVFVLRPLNVDDLVQILQNALHSPLAFPNLEIVIKEEILKKIAIYSDGDARKALNTLEILVLNSEIKNKRVEIQDELLADLLGVKFTRYDKNGEEHFNLISALHKSMRNSDADSAIYWLGRMLESGENPLYIARRLVRFASEDVGLADNGALNLAVNVFHACHFLGMPECAVHLTQAVIYLSLTPKSNAVDCALQNAKDDIKKTINEPVPLHLRNATTKLMRELGYGEGYQFAHDFTNKLTLMPTRPDAIATHQYYFPSEDGNEIRMKQRLEWLKNQRMANNVKENEAATYPQLDLVDKS